MKSRGFALNRIVSTVRVIARQFNIHAQDLRIHVAVNYAVDYCIRKRIDVFTEKGEAKLKRELATQFVQGGFEP